MKWFRKAVILLLVAVCVAILRLEAPVYAANEAIHATDVWTSQSLFVAPAKKPEVKWGLDFKDYVRQLVVDSKGTLYVISHYSGHPLLTAVTPKGEVKWAKRMEHINSISDMYLYKDSSLVILGDDIPERGRGSENFGTASISNYTLDGEQIWEKRYKDYTANYNVDVSKDGVIIFTASYVQVIHNNKPISQGQDFKEEKRLLGVNMDGSEKFNSLLGTEINSSPFFVVSDPVFVKDRIFLTLSSLSSIKEKGRVKSGELIQYSLAGKKISGTRYTGENLQSPIYDNHQIYVVGNDDLHIFDAQGKLKKTVKGGFQSTSNSLAPSISKQGDVVFGTNIYHALSKKVTTFNKENQTYFTSEPIIDRNGNLIYHYKNYAKNINYLVSMNLATAKVNWKMIINHDLQDQWLVSRDGTIYVTGTKLLAIR
ncbi:hypothetical protein [Paenibacillus xylanexedens]|uniref:hypothetical protein n=1 Tax=Paenibacillus xylanexedens TaxID=528191 RepID=UPI0011A6956D|nr:hypothetical protein [Paenibacillus xylanexedens]